MADEEWAWTGRGLFSQAQGREDRKEITDEQKMALIRSEKARKNGSYEFKLYVDSLQNGELYTVCDYWNNNFRHLGESPTRTLYEKTPNGRRYRGMLTFYTPLQWRDILSRLDQAVVLENDPLPAPTRGDEVPQCPTPFSMGSVADRARTMVLGLRDAVFDYPELFVTRAQGSG